MKARIKPKDILSKQTRKAVNQYVLEEVDRTKKRRAYKVFENNFRNTQQGI